jgi:hypothetical protein
MQKPSKARYYAKLALIVTLMVVAILFSTIVLSTAADAARQCGPGLIWRPSLGICQTKAKAPREYVKRVAKASIKHRYKRPPVKRAQLRVKPVPVLECDALCRLTIALPQWVENNRETFQ